MYIVVGLWGFFESVMIVFREAGFLGGVIGFCIFPITFTLAPWYEALVNSNWFPVMLIYGGGICATVLIYISSIFLDDVM